MTETLSLYFTHPEETYATLGVLEVLRALHQEYPDHKIIDPEDLDSLPSHWLSCKQCMQERMKKVIFPTIEKCEKFAIWAPVATCGVECALHKAWELGKEVIYVSYENGEVDFEELTLKEYHYTEVATEVV